MGIRKQNAPHIKVLYGIDKERNTERERAGLTSAHRTSHPELYGIDKELNTERAGLLTSSSSDMGMGHSWAPRVTISNLNVLQSSALRRRQRNTDYLELVGHGNGAQLGAQQRARRVALRILPLLVRICSSLQISWSVLQGQAGVVAHATAVGCAAKHRWPAVGGQRVEPRSRQRHTLFGTRPRRR